MWGEDRESRTLFSYVICEVRVPADHPLRAIRAIVAAALEVLSPEFERLYSKVGWPSIPPEMLTRTGGLAEREAALAMLERRQPGRRITLAADKAYDVRLFIEVLRVRRVTPHIAIDGNIRVNGRPRSTAIDRRTTRHPGYAVSQHVRKRIEESFGWIKTTGNLAKTRHRGLDRVGWTFTLTAAYNLVRIPKLMAAG